MTESRFPNLIGGAWREAEQWSENRNPSDPSDLVGRFACADLADLGDAIAAARHAQAAWATASPQTRFDVLDKAGDLILARKAQLGDLLAREEGKSLPEAIGEAARAGMIFKFFAGEALRLSGEILPSVRDGIKVEITREPVGLVGAITPWNFPIAIPAWKTAPALAYGNAVVLKPAEVAPGCAWKLGEILVEAGLPAGVFSLVMGPGRVLGAALCQQVDAVSFTGSTGVGHQVLAAATGAGVKVQLEMGGKNPMIVLDDADIDLAVNCALQSAFFSTGQRCTASSRLIVTDGVADRFVERLAAACDALVVGDPRAPGTQIGPVASEAQYASVRGYIDGAVAQGAQMVAGAAGSIPNQGLFIRPTLFDRTTPEMTINREEVFGPVASVLRVADYDAALAAANDTEFGLTAGICTTSLARAEHFKRHAQAGMVMVNLPTAGVDYHVPFGGRKASSYGAREQGSYAREFFTTVKTAYQSA